MRGFESPDLPTSWTDTDETVFCLACRRALAGEAGVEAGDPSMSAKDRARARRDAIVEFEIGRDGGRSDQVIARACGTSPMVVARTRQRRH